MFIQRFKYTADFKFNTVNKFWKSKFIQKQIYPIRAHAKSEVFEYAEEFHDRAVPMRQLGKTSQAPLPMKSIDV